MSDTEDDQSTQDDLEVEIIDLDDEGTRYIPSLGVEEGHALSTSQHHGRDTSGPYAWPRWSQLSLKQRVLRLAVTVSLVSLALVILLGTIRTTAQGLFFGPTPTPAPALLPGSDFFYIDASPSWGNLVLDGNRISHPPVMGWDAPLHLARGRHQLVWSADPFRPLHCSISVPIAFNDSCPYEAAQQNEFGPTHPNVVPNSWNLSLFESITTLPLAQRTALVQAILRALDTLQSTETVYPGERYLHTTASHTIVEIATRPLQARLHFQLTTADASNSLCLTGTASCLVQMQGQDCRTICTQPAYFFGRQEGWFVSIFVSVVWDYATSDDQIIAQNQPGKLPDITTFPESELLQTTWEGRNWHVSVGFQGSGASDLACSSAIELVNSAVPDGQNMGYQISSSTGLREAAGCLIGVIPQPDNLVTPSSSSAPAAYYLYRFGVLLAVNSLARRLSPQLPLADAYEQHLAQQLVQANINP